MDVLFSISHHLASVHHIPVECQADIDGTSTHLSKPADQTLSSALPTKY